MTTPTTPTPTLRVAVGQAPVVVGDIAGNVAIAADLTRQAAARGARLLVLPEAFLTGYSVAAFTGDVPTEAGLAAELHGLVEAVEATGCTVVVSTPVDRATHRTLSSVLVAPGRGARVVYDKQHLSGYESDHFTPGRHGTTIVVDGWHLGLSICYDGSFPEHARAAADAGAHGYLNSNAFFPGGSERQELYVRARALDNGLFAVSSGMIGTIEGVDFVGGSGVHDPEGRRLVRMGTDSGVAVADLDWALLTSTRAAHPMHADHLDDLGGRLLVEG